MSYAAGDLTGNTVYTGSQPQPTTGTVNPSGYVDRELNKPSTTRSGLAAAALRRLGGNASPKVATHTRNPSVKPVRTSTGRIVNATRNPGVQGTPVGQKVAQPQQIQQNQTAITQPAQPAPETQTGQQAAHIPLNPDIADMIAQQQAAETQNEAMAQQRLNDLLRANTEQQGIINQQAPIQQNNLAAGFGGRGMFFSTGEQQGMSNLQDTIARRLADLQTAATTDQRNYQEALQTGQRNLADQIAADYQKNAQEWDQLQSTMDLKAVGPDGTLNTNQLINDTIPQQDQNLVKNGAQSAAGKAPAGKAAPKPHGMGGLTAKGAQHPSQKKSAPKGKGGFMGSGFRL